jgi:hypothetical protein
MIVKASQAIELLKGYAPDDELVIMWWDYDLVNSWEHLTVNEWSDVVEDLGDMDLECERIAEAITDTVSSVVNSGKVA